MRGPAACALLLLAVTAATARHSGRHAFYRDMRGAGAGAGGVRAGQGARRVFGGSAVPLAHFPGACALLDRYWSTRCSGAVLSARWVLTAAHCAVPGVAYVKFNARRPAAPEGDVAAVHYLYRHPKYEVVQEDEGRGPDVTALRHDVGLVRTRSDMALRLRSAPWRAPRRLRPQELRASRVEVLGFGRTERAGLGEELLAVRLQLVDCERGSWLHCVCGEGVGGGVCAGDSGGPVLLDGEQVAVTSMGPLECASGSAPLGATSVFTSLAEYADVINSTIFDADSALGMRVIAGASRRALPPLGLLPLLLLLSLGPSAGPMETT